MSVNGKSWLNLGITLLPQQQIRAQLIRDTETHLSLNVICFKYIQWWCYAVNHKAGAAGDTLETNHHI